MKRLVFYPQIIALMLSLFLFGSCGHMFYYPHEKIYYTPDQFEVDYQELDFKHQNGHTVKSWVLEPKGEPKATIVHFHGNAENRSTHFMQVAWMTEHGYRVVVWDYSGYADSDGKAGREQIYKDSLLVLSEVSKQFPGKLIAFGQSLGGNIAFTATAENLDRIDLLVLDSTFASYQGIAFDKLKSFWGTFLLSPLAFVLVNDDKAAQNYFKEYEKFQGKVLVAHGEADTIIPIKFGKELYDSVPLEGERKKRLWFKGMNHLQAFSKEEYRQAFVNTVDEMIQAD